MDRPIFPVTIPLPTLQGVDWSRRGDEEPWLPHPKFSGVRLRKLIGGAETEGRFSCHLVDILPDHGLERHDHPAQWEVHQVIRGSGQGLLAGAARDYHPGLMVVIPPGVEHRLWAHGEGLAQLAWFLPPLA